MTAFDAIRNFLKIPAMDAGKLAFWEPGMLLPFQEMPVHVWSARYSDLEQQSQLLSSLLSTEEVRTAAGFKKSGDARRFILRHGMVRAVLAQYMLKDPAEIWFSRGRNGKPDLGGRGTFPDIRFSLSSTDEMVALGITLSSEIGLDIVRIQSRDSFLAVARYLFTPGERQWIGQAAPHSRPLRFFRVWALKEALLKASGGDVRVMKEADVSGFLTEPFLSGYYMVNLEETDKRCFIREAVCGTDHHYALAVMPGISTKRGNPIPWTEAGHRIVPSGALKAGI